MQARTCVMGWMLLAAMLLAGTAYGNNITVTNVIWRGASADAVASDVQVDLAWENSWRATWPESDHVSGSPQSVENWDAAWVFVKYRTSGGAWKHATLSTDAAAHVIPAAAGGVAMTNTVGLTAGRTPGEGVGVFIHRAGNGHGNLDLTNVKLRWLHGADEVAADAAVDIQVHAIEMVYVPEGAFKVGTGGNEYYSFKNGNTDPAFLVDATWSGVGGSNDDTRQISSNSVGRLCGFGWGAQEGTLHDNYPTGYSAFYCMKYDITQGQYAAFLNALTRVEQAARFASQTVNNFMHDTTTRTTPANRNGVRLIDITSDPLPRVYANDLNTNNAPNSSDDGQYVACNWLVWGDMAAYKAWAGLRPMTELEYEKACRGVRNPVIAERAWGTTSVNATKYTLSAAGAADESIATGYNETGTHGNCNYESTRPDDYQGPLRAGVFATSGSGRVEAGASYWGIMELSGNLQTTAVHVYTGVSRDFQGTHGLGTTALRADWPSTATGTGWRGGDWSQGSALTPVSYRRYANIGRNFRDSRHGGRAVRSAP